MTASRPSPGCCTRAATLTGSERPGSAARGQGRLSGERRADIARGQLYALRPDPDHRGGARGAVSDRTCDHHRFREARRAERGRAAPGRRRRVRAAAVAKRPWSRSREGGLQSASDTPSSHSSQGRAQPERAPRAHVVAQRGPERGEPGPKQVVAKERVRPAAGAHGRIHERHATLPLWLERQAQSIEQAARMLAAVGTSGFFEHGACSTASRAPPCAICR